MFKLQIRYQSKKHFTTIETSATGAEGLAWGFKQCLAPYGVATVRILDGADKIIVRASRNH